MVAKAKIVHVIGDSHVTLFSGKDEIVPVWNEPHEDLLPLFKTYRLGAMLAYNLATERHEGRDKLFACIKTLPKNSKVLVCFGEIDCRAHLVKQARAQDRTLDDVARECAGRYAEALRDVSKLCKLGVWGATPQTAAEHSSNKFPTVGTQAQRNYVTKLFNDYVAMACETFDVPCFSIFDKLVDSAYLVGDEWFMDSAHLNQKALPLALEELAPFLK